MTLQPNLDACQFGGVARRSTRDAVALAGGVLRRHEEQRRCLGLGRRNAKTALPCFAMALVDLSKAFDLLVCRGDPSLDSFVEELHRWVCHILMDKHTGHQLKRILTRKGVRPGSVEGPACFLAPCDIATVEVQSAGDREAVLVFPRGPGPVVKRV